MLGDMEKWDSSALKGAKVWIKVSGSGEVHGAIDSVKTLHASADREDAVNFSVFVVQLDNGVMVECPGSGFSRIEGESYP